MHVKNIRKYFQRYIYLNSVFIVILNRYCNSSYTFPSQKEVLDLSVSLSLSALQENPKTLIVVGSYTIGKEKVFLGKHL